MSVTDGGDRLPGAWVWSHNDHKPDNALYIGPGHIAILDWDGCGHTHPRLEAVESALRWSGGDAGEPQAGIARAFLSGYQGVAGSLGPVDFAKWVTALAGWFGFTGARALGDFGGPAGQRRAAAATAAAALANLDRTLASLDRWAESLAGRSTPPGGSC